MTSIICDHVMHDGKRSYRITELTGFLKYSDLPSEYTKGCPSMYRADTCGGEMKFIKVYAADPSASGNYYVGHILTPPEFVKLVHALKASGRRLAEINDRIRQDAKGWIGETTEVIV